MVPRRPREARRGRGADGGVLPPLDERRRRPDPPVGEQPRRALVLRRALPADEGDRRAERHRDDGAHQPRPRGGRARDRALRRAADRAPPHDRCARPRLRRDPRHAHHRPRGRDAGRGGSGRRPRSGCVHRHPLGGDEGADDARRRRRRRPRLRHRDQRHPQGDADRLHHARGRDRHSHVRPVRRAPPRTCSRWGRSTPRRRCAGTTRSARSSPARRRTSWSSTATTCASRRRTTRSRRSCVTRPGPTSKACS